MQVGIGWIATDDRAISISVRYPTFPMGEFRHLRPSEGKHEERTPALGLDRQ